MPEQGDNIHVPPIYTFSQEAQGRINSSVLWTESHHQNGIPPISSRDSRPGVEVMWGKMDAEVVAFDASEEEVSSGTMTIWDLNVEEAPYTFAATTDTVDVHNLTLNTLAADTMIQVHRDPKTDKWFYNAAAATSSGIQYLELTADMTDGSAAAKLYERSSDGTTTEATGSDTYVVKDELGAFKYSKSGAFGYGYLIATEDVSSEVKNYTYAAILFETQCQFFTADLTEDLEAGQNIAQGTLENIRAIGSFPYTQVPAAAPAVRNKDKFKLSSAASTEEDSKKVLVGWSEAQGEEEDGYWVLLAVQPVVQTFVTDVRLNTEEDAAVLEMKQRSVYVMTSAEETDWLNIFTAEECSE